MSLIRKQNTNAILTQYRVGQKVSLFGAHCIRIRMYHTDKTATAERVVFLFVKN